MEKFGVLVLLFVGLVGLVSAHPATTFLMTITDEYGGIPANYSTGQLTTIYFTLPDLLHNGQNATFSSMMLYHARYMHILMVSEDFELTLHVHPDDFQNMTAANLTTIFYYQTTFPRAGKWSVSCSFLMTDSQLNRIREGFAQTEFTVYGTPGAPGMNPNPVFDYRDVNRFKSYPIGSNEVFTDYIDINSNLDSSNSGFVVMFQVNPYGNDFSSGSTGMMMGTSGMSMSGGMMSGMMSGMSMGAGVEWNFTQNVNVSELSCTYFYLSVLYYDAAEGMLMPATAVPFLAAPVHFTLANYDNAVYHAHGTFLPNDGTTFPDVVNMMYGMTDNEMNTMNPSDPMYGLMMNSMMIGVTNNNTINCTTDEGDVMMRMPTMDMSEYYGPSNFSIVSGIFDFPNSGHWRLFAYMKVKLPSGEERLIVPNFSIYVMPKVIPPDQESSMSMPMGSAAFLVPSFAAISMILLSLSL